MSLSLRRPAFVTCVVLSLAGGCRSNSASPPEEVPAEVGLSRAGVLEAAGACALTTAKEFEARAGRLYAEVVAFRDHPSEETRAAARAAFRAAMAAWQTNEPMRFGPSAARTVLGGQDLRDQIYSWPLVSRCAVEEQLVSRGYEAPGFGDALVNRRGLGALEYLLFYDGEDTACAPGSTAVASGGWAALSTDERALRKRAYAAAVAADVKGHAEALVAAWDPARGNFFHVLGSAGTGNEVFPSTQAALNAVSDGLFYLEREVKDMKLAGPLGLRDCAQETCPELLESAFAAHSKASIAANLEGFRRLLEGCEEDHAGIGFDDLLVAVSANELATTFRERALSAEAALAAVEEEDLEEALAADRASVRALYDGVKAVTDLLKTDFISVLDLELPRSLEGDND